MKEKWWYIKLLEEIIKEIFEKRFKKIEFWRMIKEDGLVRGLIDYMIINKIRYDDKGEEYRYELLKKELKYEFKLIMKSKLWIINIGKNFKNKEVIILKIIKEEFKEEKEEIEKIIYIILFKLDKIYLMIKIMNKEIKEEYKKVIEKENIEKEEEKKIEEKIEKILKILKDRRFIEIILIKEKIEEIGKIVIIKYIRLRKYRIWK